MTTSGIHKILIVRLGALGDILHALPAQQALGRSFPDAEIHWLCEPAYARLVGAVPGISRVWTADTKRWRSQPWRAGQGFALIRALRRVGFDVVFDFQGLVKSALLAGFSGAPRRIGFDPERFKEKGIQFFYTETSPGEANLDRHVIDTNLDLVAKLAPMATAEARIPLRIPAPDEDHVQRELARLDVSRPVVINPGAGWVTKMWPAENYARLGREIERRAGYPVVYTYGPGEEALIERIRAANPPGRARAFPTSILQLAALCRLATLMVAGDSGPLHLAVAMGTATVAVLGPTSAARNGPKNPEDLVVKRDLPCSNSYKRTCDRFICMDIPMETVLESVLTRLQRLDGPDLARTGGVTDHLERV